MVNSMIRKYDELFNLEKTIAKDLFEKVNNPWEVLPLIKDYILEIIPSLGEDYNKLKEDMYVHKSVKINPSAYIEGPTIICEGTEIRYNAYIRGSVIIGKNCVIGNSTEVKNSILFDGVNCPHFNYVGDSVLGENSHTGAGVILSNVRSDKKNVRVESIETNLRKMGAIVGANVEIGCNSVVCPGTIIGGNTSIYPLTMVRGVIPSNSIVKTTNEVVKKK